MKFIAHRGLRKKEIKENTIASFLNAINNPIFSGFEFDIRKTKDEKYIVNHNAFLKHDLIRTKTLKELKQNYRIITLEEVLNLKTNKIFLIEIKDSDINIKTIHKILKKYSNQNIYIMSFHNKVIASLKEQNPPYKLGILNYVLNSLEKYDYDFICLLNNLTNEELINIYHKKNIDVFIYGVLNENKDLKFKNVTYIVNNIPKEIV